jgi:hypothetical protein
MRKCPSCGKQIGDHANVCWFCSTVIKPDIVTSDVEKDPRTGKKVTPWETVVIKILLVAILLVVGWRLIKDKTRDHSDQIDAVEEVESFINEELVIATETKISRSQNQTVVTIGSLETPIELTAADKTVLLEKNDWQITLEKGDDLDYKEFYVAYNLGTIPKSNDERPKDIFSHLLLLIPVTDQQQIQNAKKYLPAQKEVSDAWKKDGTLQLEMELAVESHFELQRVQTSIQRMTENYSFLMFPAHTSQRQLIATLGKDKVIRIKGFEYNWTAQTYLGKTFPISAYASQLKVIYASEIVITE